MQDPRKILLIEDDQRIASVISKGLSEKGYSVEVAFDGKIGLKMAQTNEFDLILLDLNLPIINGYQVCSTIRQRDTQIPIIMMTALGETEDKIEGFEQGADDYLVKPFDFRELLARVNVFMKRRGTDIDLQADVLQVKDLTMNLVAKSVQRDGVEIELTPKEFSLLEYLIKHKNRVISKEEIAEKIWENTTTQNMNVIEVYINFLRKKVDKDFETKLIFTKTGMGYVLKDE